jgi:hypothetical protein
MVIMSGRKRGGRRKKIEPLSWDFNLAAVSEENGRFTVGVFRISGQNGWFLATEADEVDGTIRDHTFRDDGLLGSMILEFKTRKQLFGFLEIIKWGKCPSCDDGYRRLVNWRR